MATDPRATLISTLTGATCLLVFVGSCAESVRDPGAGVLTYEEAASISHAKLCEELLECPAGVRGRGVSNHRAVLRTRDRCIGNQIESLEGSAWLTDLLEGFASGRILFDGERAAECAALPVTCEAFPRESEARVCSAIITGTIPVGGECRRPNDCEDGSYCRGGGGSCPGLCTPRSPLGGPCERSSECTRDGGSAECDTSVEPNVCVIRALRFGAPLGETCGIQPTGERVVCDGRFWCDGTADAAGICREPIPIGARNEIWDSPCEGLSFRDPSTRTCETAVLGDQPGDPCDGPGLARHMCDPLANLICIAGSCELAGAGTLGSRCDVDGLGGDTCRVGFYCDWDSFTCAGVKGAGAPCTSDRECEFSCNIATGTCTDRFCGGFL